MGPLEICLKFGTEGPEPWKQRHGKVLETLPS